MGSNNKEMQLAEKPVGPLLFSLALPAISAQIINLLYNLVDRIYIGRMPGDGALALTGLGVTMPVIIIISAFASLIGYGGAPFSAIHMGKGENDKAQRILGNCFSGLVLISVALTGIVSVWKEPIIRMLGASAETSGYAEAYLEIYLLGTIFVQISLGLNSFISAQGFARVSMCTVLIGAVLNIILDPIFIYGLNMGVRGAAAATVISQSVSAVWVLVFLCGKKTLLRIQKKNLYMKKEVILPVLALGISPFIMTSTESALAICFNTSLQRYGGDPAVGAMTILQSLMQFALLPLQGLSQGMQPIVSFNYGAKNAKRVRKVFRLTLACSVGYSALLWCLCEFAPHTLAMAFTKEPALIDYAAWAMRIYMGGVLIFGAQIACQQTFLALGNAKVSLFLAVLRKLILLIPLIYILPNFFENKVFAVFLAEPVSDILAVVTTVTAFTITFKRMMREIET